MGCTFCATGSMGFKSNLTSGEIVEQLVHASRISPIRNIVFMVIAFSQLAYLLVLRLSKCEGHKWKFQHVDFVCRCQGMGEPLNNYRALVEAINVMTGLPFQLSPKRITVSTVGIAN